MGLENPDIIDAVGTETGSGDVILTIFDGNEWDDELVHLRALQDKINSYFSFIESGRSGTDTRRQ